MSQRLVCEVQVLWMPGWFSNAKVFHLSPHNLTVVAPVHDEVVQQVGLRVLCAGAPGIDNDNMKRNFYDLIPESPPISCCIENLLGGCFGRG